MSPEATARGTIIKVPDTTPGLLFVNGEQKSFNLEGVWRHPSAPAPNMLVNVVLDGDGNVAAIMAVEAAYATAPAAGPSQGQQLANVAQEKGKEAAKMAQEGVGALAKRMGTVALASAVVVWIAWFFLPAAGVSGGFAGNMSWTFWDLMGVDFTSGLGLVPGTANHGAFAYLGLLCIIAPFVAPFLRMPWAKYLYAAPVAFTVLGFVVTWMQESKAMGGAAGVPNPFGWSWGFYVLVLAGLVLASGALKKSA
jgi:hypothetical protein